MNRSKQNVYFTTKFKYIYFGVCKKFRHRDNGF